MKELFDQGKTDTLSHYIKTILLSHQVRRSSAMEQQRSLEKRDALSHASHTPSRSSSALPICTCRCNTAHIAFIDSDEGYGKYCGAGYTCARGDAGCDSLDACCKIHDACITQYCNSCLCNIALAQCTGRNATGVGFAPCDSLMGARKDVLDNICIVIRYAPSDCGGCDNDVNPVPAECNGYGYFSDFV